MLNTATTATRVLRKFGNYQANHLVGLLAATTFIAVTLCGCSDGDTVPTQPACNEGAQHTCKADTGCIGLQECSSNGTWSQCECDTTTTGHALLGGNCSDDSNCASGATCLLPSSTEWLGGGPPEGLCVADCSADVDACNSFANAICVASNPNDPNGAKRSLCMPKCDLTVGTPDAFACGAVPSSACEPLESSNEGFCRPFCTFGSDCPSGHCDRQLGVCRNEAVAAPTVSFGGSCAPNAPSCDGVCLKLSPTANICSVRCLYGSHSECATEGASPIAGVCAYATAMAKPGNIGYCTPLCDCNDDCAASGFVCRAFSTKDTQTALEHVGMCVPELDTTGAAQVGVACAGGD